MQNIVLFIHNMQKWGNKLGFFPFGLTNKEFFSCQFQKQTVNG